MEQSAVEKRQEPASIMVIDKDPVLGHSPEHYVVRRSREVDPGASRHLRQPPGPGVPRVARHLLGAVN